MDIVNDIQYILEEMRPILERDGGGVEIDSFENGDLTLNLLGACSGCPMSSITFGVVLENKLREALGDKIKNIYYNRESSELSYNLSK
ncbi:MAG: hypothetical protein RLZZ223_426 [Candidatus Parcubacteria bacterium]|jgi:Fe-S cluster biogenesis protein NfuA